MNDDQKAFFDVLDAPVFSDGGRFRPANRNEGLMYTPSFGGFTPVQPGFSEKGEAFYWVDEDEKETYLCQKFSIDAEIESRSGDEQSVLMSFTSRTDRQQQGTLKRSELSSGLACLNPLADRGFDMSPSAFARRKICEFLLLYRPDRRLTSTTETGWFYDQYVTPQRIYAPEQPTTCYMGTTSAYAGVSCSGTLGDWRERIANRCIGNPIPTLFIALPFAAPLLSMMGLAPFFVILTGLSRTGKTTVTAMANSVYRRERDLSWKTSDAALQKLFQLNRDNLLVFDEVTKSDPGRITELIYRLTNRSPRLTLQNIDLPGATSLIGLTSAEKEYQRLSADAKVDYPDGLKSRLVEIKGWREIFPERHAAGSAGALVEDLNVAVQEHYGVAGDAYLEALVKKDPVALKENHARQERIFLEELADTDPGYVRQVARQFHLAGFAGELATSMEITGWPEGHALQAAKDLFLIWKEQNHTVQAEAKGTMIRALQEYVGQNEGQMAELDGPPGGAAEASVGFKANVLGKDQFILRYAPFKAAFKDRFDFSSFCEVLIEAGILVPSSTGKNYKAQRIPKGSKPDNYLTLNGVFDSPTERPR